MGKLSWFMSLTETVTSPPREGEPTGTADPDNDDDNDDDKQFIDYVVRIKGKAPQRGAADAEINPIC